MKLPNFNEKAKTFRLFESYAFDQSKLVIIQFLDLKFEQKKKKGKASEILQSHRQSV